MTFAEALDELDQSDWNPEARAEIFAGVQRLKMIEQGLYKPLSPERQLERDLLDAKMIDGLEHLIEFRNKKDDILQVPALTTKTIRAYIRWVSKGMALGTITPSAGRGMLYAAQLMQVASPRRRKRKPKKPIGFESKS